MVVQKVTPAEAQEGLDADDNAVYLDVRTELEFRYGHPDRAINIPVAFANPGGGLQPNTHFVDVIARALAKDTPIYCGCQAGRRSVAACELLVRAGYEKVFNVQGGFGGAVDQNGVLVQPGWRDSGLPVSADVTDANSYQGLKQMAGV